LLLEAPDNKGLVDFSRNGYSVIVELELDEKEDKLRVVTKVIEAGASSWKQDEHEVTLEMEGK
jgi:hypothetical protein